MPSFKGSQFPMPYIDPINPHMPNMYMYNPFCN